MSGRRLGWGHLTQLGDVALRPRADNLPKVPTTMYFALALVSSSLYAAAYASIGPSADLYITNKDIAPDGFSRPTVLAGATAKTGTFPGPLISGKMGDFFGLNLINQLNDTRMLTTTSIHWHGFFQEGTNWADGPVGVNQCPILPGNSFFYGFNAKDQAGTFWYHSHHSTQYCDGLRGPIVVYDPNDPFLSMYDVDDESTVITLADWYHTPARLGPKFPQPNATLINGLGRYPSGPNSPLAVINVQPNKRYRFRLVSISCFPFYNFSIDGHNMTIIETDTVNTQPVTVDSIQIFIGQRYSFVLTANQPINNYWIRANPNVGPTGFTNGINSAILRYKGAPIADPTTPLVASTNPMLETNLHPTTDPAAPGVPVQGGGDVNINFDIFFNTTDQKYYVNGASFAPPASPVLLQVLSGARTAQELLPAGSVYVLPRNKTIEVTIPGGAPGFPHPIHLHGQTFNVIRSAGSTTYNYVNPIQRDVVSTGISGDNVTFRFETNNPGPWIMHCHIDWHLDTGLAIAFVSDIDASANISTPQAWQDLCPAYINSGLP